MTKTDPNTEELAEKIWRAEAFRVTGRDRSVPWSEIADKDQEKYRFLARALETPPEPTEDQYLIWSNEHSAWWRPESAGYTVSTKEAGRYSKSEAIEICRWGRNGWRRHDRRPDELPIRVSDVPEDLL